MTDEQYIRKTRHAVKFLMDCRKDNLIETADIINAQAEQDTPRLIRHLQGVRNLCQIFINQLEDMKG